MIAHFTNAYVLQTIRNLHHPVRTLVRLYWSISRWRIVGEYRSYGDITALQADIILSAVKASRVCVRRAHL